MTARLFDVFAGESRPETFGAEVKDTGFRRKALKGPVIVTETGIAGDELADARKLGRENHALYLFNRAHYPVFEKVLSRSLPPASFAENLAYEGPDETELRIGDHLTIGEVTLAITTPRIPCFKLRHFLNAPQGFPADFSASGRTGFYARVVKSGRLRASDTLHIVKTDVANATVADLNAALTGFDLEPDLVDRVLASPDLLPGAAAQIRDRVARFRPEVALRPKTGRIVGKSLLSPDTAEIRIACIEVEELDWAPGQFITLGHADARGSIAYRCYSLISGPTRADPGAPFAIAVRATPGADTESSVSTRLVETDITDSKVVLYPPSGTFTPPTSRLNNVLYIAGGIGITPILAHLRAQSGPQDQYRSKLVYVARSHKAAVFADELAHIASSRDGVDFELWLTEPSQTDPAPHRTGRPDISQLIHDASPTAEVYVCGPLGMIKAAQDAFAAAGRPNSKLHFELFEAPPLDGSAEMATSAEVRLPDGRTSGRWTPEAGTLLEWIEAETNLRPPAACRSGLCRTCEATLAIGSVVYPAGITSPEAGRVLLCCARPVSKVIEIGLPAGTRTATAAMSQDQEKEVPI